MEWNIQGGRPIYAQLIEQVTLAIVSGVYAPGERLASVRELAMQAGVNPNTMQRALAQMEEQGLLYTQRTAGRFVTEDVSVIRQARQRLAVQQAEQFLGAFHLRFLLTQITMPQAKYPRGSTPVISRLSWEAVALSMVRYS